MGKIVFLNKALKRESAKSQGVPGYKPLPEGYPWEKMTEKQKTDEIRHWLTIAENSKAQEAERKAAMRILHKTHPESSIIKE